MTYRQTSCEATRLYSTEKSNHSRPKMSRPLVRDIHCGITVVKCQFFHAPRISIICRYHASHSCIRRTAASKLNLSIGGALIKVHRHSGLICRTDKSAIVYISICSANGRCRRIRTGIRSGNKNIRNRYVSARMPDESADV